MNRTRFPFAYIRSLVVVLVAAIAALTSVDAQSFSLDDITGRALALSTEEYRDHRKAVPRWMLVDGSMTYDQWRDIRFRPDHALWTGSKSPFRIQFFHPGFLYERSIRVNVVDSKGVKPLALSPSDFDYGKNEFGSRVPQALRPAIRWRRRAAAWRCRRRSPSFHPSPRATAPRICDRRSPGTDSEFYIPSNPQEGMAQGAACPPRSAGRVAIR